MSKDTQNESTSAENAQAEGAQNEAKTVDMDALRAKYQEVLGKNVSNAKKNDAEWIQGKIDAELAKAQSNDDTQDGDNKETPTPTPKANAKVKIELLCDVLTGDGKKKKGEKMELTHEELADFADSFYKKL
jgi:predicted phage tail protein